MSEAPRRSPREIADQVWIANTGKAMTDAEWAEFVRRLREGLERLDWIV